MPSLQSVTMLDPEIDKVHTEGRPAAPDVVGSMSFGARLRAERERREISIASIADKTKILGALLEGLENDDVSRWPSGFYRRAFFRAYASAIGIDTESVLREFVERFPDADEPTPFHAVDTDLMASSTANHPLLRLTLADAGPFFAGGPVIRSLRPRLRAVALDAFVLSVVGLSLFVALGVFWAPLSIAVAAYYFGSILILGNTPGVCLFASHSKTEPD
ncbi:MAG: helix-turn-helix domain-containing protein [Vicinamibacterales bacterium]